MVSKFELSREFSQPQIPQWQEHSVGVCYNPLEAQYPFSKLRTVKTGSPVKFL